MATQPRRILIASEQRRSVATVLSFLFPGLGQAYNRQPRLAAAFALPVVVAITAALAAVFALGGPPRAAAALLDTRLLTALVVADLALLGWRLAAMVQAAARGAPAPWRGWSVAVTAVLVLATIAMHALPAYYALKGIETLEAIALDPAPSDAAAPRGGAVVLPPPSVHPAVDRGERITILLLGIDFEAGRHHHLTDTMLVATLDPETGRAAMVSVPRDLYGVPLGDGRTYNAKLNSLMAQADADPETYPLGGAGSLKAAIGTMLDTRIHYVAAIDIAGFRSLVDAIGGVDVVVTRSLYDPTNTDPATNAALSFQPGLHHMGGGTALAYVRSRMGAGESDFTRAERQQAVLGAIAEKLTAGNPLVTLPALLDAIGDSVQTDIPAERFASLGAAAQEANLGAVERFVLDPPEYVTADPSSPAGYILHPELDAIRALGERLFGRTEP